jgi:hypothetical protein
MGKGKGKEVRGREKKAKETVQDQGRKQKTQKKNTNPTGKYVANPQIAISELPEVTLD